MNSMARAAQPKKKIAICCAGGGMLGAVEYGYLKRIYERKIQPSMLFGTSAGALNVAGFAMGDLDLMEWIWLNISNATVKRFAPWLLFTPKACLYDSAPLEKLLRKHFDIPKIQRAGIPVYITRSNTITYLASHWRLDLHQRGVDPIKVLLGSTAIPALFPPVNAWYDGGLSDNYNAQLAADLGATEILMLHASQPRPINIRSIRDVPEVVLANLQWANYQRQRDAIKCHPAQPKLIELLPSFPVGLSMFDFDAPLEARKEAMQQGYELAVRVLG